VRGASKVALRGFLKSGATIGEVHEYFDFIAIVKWLNNQFGYHLTVPEFLAEDSPWDEWALDMHMIYADTFNDEKLKAKLRSGRLRERIDRKGHFCTWLELPRSNE
jgi:hypothetical protein